MKLAFTKMEGCGNDYVYINGFTEKVPQEEKPALVRRLSDRHFGIGGDGVIFINPSEQADFEMEMYNADGSRGKMCGNGIRCVAKYVWDQGLTRKNPLTIESSGKVKTLFLNIQNGKVDTVRVDMGCPILTAREVPADPEAFRDGTNEQGRLIDAVYQVDGTLYAATVVSMGNPHAVIFTEDIKSLDLLRMGPAFETHAAFPEGVNTEFVEIVNKNEIRMRVWERGSGETLACGTGACASVVAGVLTGRTEREVQVHLIGGDLKIHWAETDGHVSMTGPARTVFRGTVLPEDFPECF